MLMHQGFGLDAFNALPTRRAALFRRADALLFSLSEDLVHHIMAAHPKVGSRPGSAYSHAEQCSLFDARPGVMHLLDGAARRYAEKFGFEFVMHIGRTDAHCSATAVTAAIGGRMHNDVDTERKVVRNEIAKLNRSRLERMLGPERGYDNWT
ncbi:MAG: 2-oxo-4-hydroxy-4-carboxy-5-ureidoimidazoline decarboxylase [Mycobacterium sp.]